MKKGFTLTELIVSLAIFSIAMVTISMVFFASLNTRQTNDVKQSTAGYAQAIIENFRTVGYSKINDLYKGDMTTGVSKFVYFNNMSNLNVWFQKYISGTTIITGNEDSRTYPLSTENQFGALIKISKVSITENVAEEIFSYHIYVRVWELSKGSKGQSVRDIYESR